MEFTFILIYSLCSLGWIFMGKFEKGWETDLFGKRLFNYKMEESWQEWLNHPIFKVSAWLTHTKTRVKCMSTLFFNRLDFSHLGLNIYRLWSLKEITVSYKYHSKSSTWQEVYWLKTLTLLLLLPKCFKNTYWCDLSIFTSHLKSWHPHSSPNMGPGDSTLEQRKAHYSHQAHSGPPFVFVNKVLLEHGHLRLFNYCL